MADDAADVQASVPGISPCDEKRLSVCPQEANSAATSAGARIPESICFAGVFDGAPELCGPGGDLTAQDWPLSEVRPPCCVTGVSGPFSRSWAVAKPRFSRMETQDRTAPQDIAESLLSELTRAGFGLCRGHTMVTPPDLSVRPARLAGAPITLPSFPWCSNGDYLAAKAGRLGPVESPRQVYCQRAAQKAQNHSRCRHLGNLAPSHKSYNEGFCGTVSKAVRAGGTARLNATVPASKPDIEKLFRDPKFPPRDSDVNIPRPVLSSYGTPRTDGRSAGRGAAFAFPEG